MQVRLRGDVEVAVYYQVSTTSLRLYLAMFAGPILICLKSEERLLFSAQD